MTRAAAVRRVHRAVRDPVESMPAIHIRLAKAAAMMGNEELALQHAAAANRYLASIDELAPLPLPPLPGR